MTDTITRPRFSTCAELRGWLTARRYPDVEPDVRRNCERMGIKYEEPLKVVRPSDNPGEWEKFWSEEPCCR